jgi:uncharacterized protein YdhG (YjbR/CyaY superfamily)
VASDFESIDAYISTFPDDVQTILQKVRTTIATVAPEAVETISYQMPTFKLRGKAVVHFAAWKSHLGLYATPSGNAAFQRDLAAYRQSKGAVRFPFDEPMPYDLITRIVEFRVADITAAAQTGERKRRSAR